MSIKDESAFPSSLENNVNDQYGLTKREYFAAMAMQGLCANGLIHRDERHPLTIAFDAVKYADALIKRLEK